VFAVFPKSLYPSIHLQSERLRVAGLYYPEVGGGCIEDPIVVTEKKGSWLAPYAKKLELL
jgi:Xaa-Pro aminopeptidase